MVPIPAHDLPDAAVPGVLVGAQQLQRGRRRDPAAVHRPGRLRRVCHLPRRKLTCRARCRPRPRPFALLVDLHRGRGRGGHLAAVRRDPLRARRPRRASNRPGGRPQCLAKGPHLLHWHGLGLLSPRVASGPSMRVGFANSISLQIPRSPAADEFTHPTPPKRDGRGFMTAGRKGAFVRGCRESPSSQTLAEPWASIAGEEPPQH